MYIFKQILIATLLALTVAGLTSTTCSMLIKSIDHCDEATNNEQDFRTCLGL